ncbi:MAG: septum formation initiator family protein [Syntrophomonadaceae bacterium]
MKDNSQRQRLVKLIITGLLGVLLLVGVLPRAINVWELAQTKSQLEQQKLELQQKQQELQQALDKMSSRETIEKIAREQLGMVKQGEKPIIPAVRQN